MINSTREKSMNILMELALCLLGTFCYALAINCFTAPNQIAPGGASGIAVLIHYLTGFKIGVFVFVFNIPFLLWILKTKSFSVVFIIRTLLATAMLSVMTDYVVVYIPGYQGNPLLAAIFGGALMGIGLALVHLAHANTGGISLLGLIMQKANPQFRVGTLIILLNILVVLLSGVVYKNVESMFYALLAVYISGLFMDKIIDNILTKNLMIIISESTDKVRAILVAAGQGVTILKGEGGYKGNQQRVMMCAANKKNCEILQGKIKAADDLALIIVTPASKIEGKGFKHLV